MTSSHDEVMSTLEREDSDSDMGGGGDDDGGGGLG